MILKVVSGLFLLSLLPLEAKADFNTDVDVCNQTPEGPAKHKCVNRLIPRVKHIALTFPKMDTLWLDNFISWDDYLGIHDADYSKAKEMVHAVQRGMEIQRQNAQRPDHGWIAAAGYYDSLGSEWKAWSKEARRVAQCVYAGDCK